VGKAIRTLSETCDGVQHGTTSSLQLRVLFSVVEGLQGTSHALGQRQLVLGRGQLFGGMVLDDPRASARHVSLTVLEDHDVLVTDLGSLNGTLINGERVQRAILGPNDVLRIGGTFFQLELNPSAKLPAEPRDVVFEEFAGGSPVAREIRDKIRSLAAVDVSVLVLGPPGAGKERVASALHRSSGRGGPLIALNCAVLTDELAGSELFGHVKGAFTGAASPRTGAFRKADGGTLFLDEIGELPLALQAKLLRVLEERRVRPVGSDVDTRVDVRIIAATNQDLPTRVHQRRFRGDLFSRIAAAVMTLPPLSERPSDIVTLAQHFLPPDVRLHPSVVQELLAHPWPHNVRDLQAVVALLRPRDGIVKLDKLALESLEVGRRLAADRLASAADVITATGSATPTSMNDSDSGGTIPWPDGKEERIALLERLLAENDGNVSAVARLLGKHSSSLRRWNNHYGIDPDRFRR
jgi:transcriptional regulator with GAF, ATPase, and Fis domain